MRLAIPESRRHGSAMDAKILDRQLIYDGWLRLSVCTLQMPNGAIEKRHIEDHGSAAAVLLYDPDRRVALLIKQPRAPVIEHGLEPMLEVVAGRIEGGSSGEATARAEAMEEAGVRIRELERVALVWQMPAVSAEQLELYLAAYQHSDRVGAGGGSDYENECITLHEIDLRELWKLVSDGALPDGKTLILVMALYLRRPDLFV